MSNPLESEANSGIARGPSRAVCRGKYCAAANTWIVAHRCKHAVSAGETQKNATGARGDGCPGHSVRRGDDCARVAHRDELIAGIHNSSEVSYHPGDARC